MRRRVLPFFPGDVFEFRAGLEGAGRNMRGCRRREVNGL